MSRFSTSLLVAQMINREVIQRYEADHGQGAGLAPILAGKFDQVDRESFEIPSPPAN